MITAIDLCRHANIVKSTRSDRHSLYPFILRQIEKGEYVLKQLGINASQAIALEDSYNGVRSTRAIDLFTIVTPNNYTAHESFVDAELVVKNLGEPGKPCEKLSGEYNPPEHINLEYLKGLI